MFTMMLENISSEESLGFTFISITTINKKVTSNLSIFSNYEETKMMSGRVEEPRDKAIKAMGDLILKGWTMTDLGCSICQIPLMRSRDGQEVCTLCSQSIATKKAPLIPAKRELSEEPPMPAQSAPKKQESKSDSASRLIGQKMLQGWALLNAECVHCQGIPLVGHRKMKVSACVICDAEYEWDPESSSNSKIPGRQLNAVVVPVEQPPVKESLPSAASMQPATDKSMEKKPKALLVLEDKIQFLTEQLSSTSDVSTIKNLADALQACAAAHDSLSSVSL